MDYLKLNVSLLRRRVPNLTNAARSVGLRPATVSNLCTGKIPVGRAEVRTLVALSSLAKCSLDELIIRGEQLEIIETGIKTLDLFAPIANGGTVGLVARPGMGQLAVLGEVLLRLKNKGYTPVLLKPEGNSPGIIDVANDVDIVAHSIEKVYEIIKEIDNHTGIILAADRSHIVTGEIYRLKERLQADGLDSFTVFLVDLKGEAVDEDLPYGPLETLWQFDADLSARYKYPAINPLHSASSVLEGGHIDQEHFSVQQRAQKLLRRYRELRSLVSVNGMKKLPNSEVDIYNRGERLEAYLTQPFYVAEEITGKKGEIVSLQEAIADVRKILDGSMDKKEVEDLDFIGKL